MFKVTGEKEKLILFSHLCRIKYWKQMKSRFIFLSFLLCSSTLVAQQLPAVVSGKIERIGNFKSRFVSSRNIDVWLPEDYNPSRKYCVLYMHDGQMLFDSSTTWNHLSWDVDDAVSRLLKDKVIQDVIVVGLWNGDKTRHADYFPQKPFKALSKKQRKSVYEAARSNGYSVFNDYEIMSDNYLRFLVKEVKPLIDQKYSTYRDPAHTFIAGSSMGGLISLYAICEYPGVFGGAACLSTHWPGIFTMEGNPVPDAFVDYMRKHLPDPGSHRIYFDYGDQTLDAMYPPLQKKADVIMKQKGFAEKSWQTRYFPGKDHSEKAWRERLDIPITFLLGK